MGDLVKALSAAFAGRRVLVTGDTGFKGSWLSMLLTELGAKVTGFALPAEAQSHFSMLDLAKSIRHVDGDIRNVNEFMDIFDSAKPEFVFHLAAQSLVRKSYEDPKTTFDTNVGGFVNCLECIRRAPDLRAATLITSDKCYLNKEWIWGYRENDELGGRDPYSASKAAAEMVFAGYAASFFRGNSPVGVATSRAGNVIGGGDWSADRLVPDCIRALSSGHPIVLRNPASTRPWQHVLEPLLGYLQLASALAKDPAHFGGSWNFGPRTEAIRTVEDVARGIVSHWGSGHVSVDSGTKGPYEARLLRLNCERAALELGWVPRWTFEKTIEETAAWYRKQASGNRAEDITRKQIRSYLESYA